MGLMFFTQINPENWTCFIEIVFSPSLCLPKKKEREQPIESGTHLMKKPVQANLMKLGFQMDSSRCMNRTQSTHFYQHSKRSLASFPTFFPSLQARQVNAMGLRSLCQLSGIPCTE